MISDINQAYEKAAEVDNQILEQLGLNETEKEMDLQTLRCSIVYVRTIRSSLELIELDLKKKISKFIQ